jgi:hypothetical protein
LAVGIVVGRPSFRQTFSVEARKKIEKIETTVANTIPNDIEETILSSDTARALHNLFQRKRKGGTARAVVFGILGGASLIGTISYKPDNVVINQGSSGSQTIQVGSSSPPVINYVFIGFSTIMVISGVSQTSKYSSNSLNILLDNYKQGKPLPLAVKSKLKKKDFR